MPGPLSSANALIEATRRIEAADSSQDGNVDLSSRFRWLRHIPDLGRSFPSVVRLSLQGTSITDLSGIEQFPNLEELTIPHLRSRDATILRQLERLKSVDADWSRVERIEFHPRAPLIELELRGTAIANLEFLGSRPTLQVLRLGHSKLASLDGVELCPNLRVLEAEQTQIGSISPLSNCSELEWLDVAQTRVRDLAPLAGLTKLQHLNLQETQVSDLSPLKQLTQLRDGPGGEAQWGLRWHAGMHFRGAPIADKTLRIMAELPNPARTQHVLDHLNDADRPISAEAEPEPPFPPENLPSQQSRGFGFFGGDIGPIELKADEETSKADGQAELHAELLIQVAEVEASVAKLDNLFPGLSADIERYANALGDDLGAVVVRALWSRGNKLRLWLDADAKRRSGDDDYPPLPAGVSASLIALVQTHNVFIMGDPVGRDCDAQRLGPEGRASAAEVVSAFRPLLSELRDRLDVVTETALEALEEATENSDFASGSSIDVEQAKSFAVNTIANFTIELVRRAYVSGIRAMRIQSTADTLKEGLLHRLGGVPVDLALLGVGATVVTFALANTVAINGILVKLPGLELLGQAMRWLSGVQ